MVNHFFSDITHFDGKIFSSLKYLVFKPGFLSKEYVAGRRASYLHPIRMYLLTSAIFFLIFFALFKIDDAKFNTKITPTQVGNLDTAEYNDISKKLRDAKINSLPELNAAPDSNRNRGFHFTPKAYKSRHEYDSILKSGSKKHNWFEKQLVYKELAINEKYKGDQSTIIKALIEKFLHSLPQMLFVLLPLLALILKLLYIRRKDFYYVDHAIFTLHLYVFIFIAMLIIFGINKLKDLTHWGLFGFISGAIILSIFFYIYKSMRNFYRQGRGKTILKYMMLMFSFLVVTIGLFLFFLAFSLFSL